MIDGKRNGGAVISIAFGGLSEVIHHSDEIIHHILVTSPLRPALRTSQSGLSTFNQ